MKKLEDWIDFMEGENWPEQTANLSLLLEHSLADQTVMDNLRHLRRAIKEAHVDNAVEKLLNDKTYLEKLHAQIMRGVRMNRPGKANLQVVESPNTVSALELDQPLSQASCSR